MAEENNTVTRTVENVDRMFSQIVVNGEVHNSERYVSPRSQQTSPAPASAQSVQGEDVYGVELNDVLHNFVDQAVTQGLADEETARQLADSILQSAIDAINALIPASASTINKLADSASVNTAVTNAINDLDVSQAGGSGKFIQAISEANGKISATDGNIDSSVTQSSTNPVSSGAVHTAIGVVQASVSDIEALIPVQATSSNQLADKNFVNSSISTNTANFLGTYTSMADIEAIQNPTNNDYVFLQTTDSSGNNLFDRYKYNADQEEWLFEYELNNSSFTAEQWATINSGLTSSSVSDAINALDVAQVGGAGKYISAISEADGKISATEETMDTKPKQDSTKACTSGGLYLYISDSITSAVQTLDVASVGGSGKYIQAISEANGKISATEETMDTAPTANSTKACTSGGIKTYVDNQISTAITQVLNTSY